MAEVLRGYDDDDPCALAGDVQLDRRGDRHQDDRRHRHREGHLRQERYEDRRGVRRHRHRCAADHPSSRRGARRHRHQGRCVGRLDDQEVVGLAYRFENVADQEAAELACRSEKLGQRQALVVPEVCPSLDPNQLLAEPKFRQPGHRLRPLALVQASGLPSAAEEPGRQLLADEMAWRR